jgi:hypothetical protein
MTKSVRLALCFVSQFAFDHLLADILNWSESEAMTLIFSSQSPCLFLPVLSPIDHVADDDKDDSSMTSDSISPLFLGRLESPCCQDRSSEARAVSMSLTPLISHTTCSDGIPESLFLSSLSSPEESDEVFHYVHNNTHVDPPKSRAPWLHTKDQEPAEYPPLHSSSFSYAEPRHSSPAASLPPLKFRLQPRLTKASDLDELLFDRGQFILPPLSMGC